MELSMLKNVEQLKEKLQQKQQGEAKQEEEEISNLITLLKAFQYTKTTYNPRPLHARLVHLPPHYQFCKPTLSSITSSDVGTVVQICGTVVKAGPIRMMEVTRTYQCLNKECGYKFIGKLYILLWGRGLGTRCIAETCVVHLLCLLSNLSYPFMKY